MGLDHRACSRRTDAASGYVLEAQTLKRLIGWRQQQERTSMRPASRQPLYAQRGGEKRGGALLAGLFQYQEHAHEFASEAQMREQVISLSAGAAPRGLMAATTGEAEIDRRNVVVARAAKVYPPATDEQRIEASAREIPFHVLPEWREADAEKFAAVAENMNLVVGRHLREERLRVERIVPGFETKKLARQEAQQKAIIFDRPQYHFRMRGEMRGRAIIGRHHRVNMGDRKRHHILRGNDHDLVRIPREAFDQSGRDRFTDNTGVGHEDRTLAGRKHVSQTGEAAVRPGDIGRHQQNERALPARVLGGGAPDLMLQTEDVSRLRRRKQLERDRHNRAQPLEHAIAGHFQGVLRRGVNQIFAIDAFCQRRKIPWCKHSRQIRVQESISVPIAPQHCDEYAAASSARCDWIARHKRSPRETAPIYLRQRPVIEYARHVFERRSNIKLLISATNTEAFSVAAAQVEAWLGAHRGSIDAAARAIDASLADAALGRMMLHRRRAIVASVISEFFARVGSRFRPYLEGRVLSAPSDPAPDLAAARAAGEIVNNICGTPPPLLFERALLAGADGRPGDAQADLEEVLAAFPGFLAAALEVARLALAAGEPLGALRALLCLERELVSTRDGAALLADALRAVGVHEAASRYDLAALASSDHSNSQGNVCAPIDVIGNIASNNRMAPAFRVATRPDGRVLYNDRGIYYLASPLVDGSLALRNSVHSLPIQLSNAENTSSLTELSEALKARLLLFLHLYVLEVQGLQGLLRAAIAARRQLSEMRARVYHLAGNYALRRTVVYRLYKRLPRAVRHFANKYFISWMRHMFAKRLSRPYEILNRDWHSGTVRERAQAGLIRIFQLRPAPLETAVTNPEEVGWENPQDLEPWLAEVTYSDSAESSAVVDSLPLRVVEELPLSAQEVLRHLANELNPDRQSSVVS